MRWLMILGKAYFGIALMQFFAGMLFTFWLIYSGEPLTLWL